MKTEELYLPHIGMNISEGNVPACKSLCDLRCHMDTTDLRLIQQIIAHESGVLSVEELDYRNTDLRHDQIRDRLESLQKTGVVTVLSADPVRDDMPSKFWAVTERGIEELRARDRSEQVGIPHDTYSAGDIMSVADDALNRSDRIGNIEQFDGRPSVPEWY